MKVGDMVSWNSSGGRATGKIEHIMRQGTLGIPNSKFSIKAEPDNPAVLIRIYRDGKPTETLVGHKASTLTVLSSKVQKAETYKPTSGMQAAARRALKWKEEGKATGAGTLVGWARANQLANGEALSLDTVKRMYSFFSRHEVDKKGKDFYNTSNPSNGRIMWDAWGGDAGFSWSRRIVERANVKKEVIWTDSAFSFNKSID
jgi:hypothetical protein